MSLPATFSLSLCVEIFSFCIKEMLVICVDMTAFYRQWHRSDVFALSNVQSQLYLVSYLISTLTGLPVLPTISKHI